MSGVEMNPSLSLPLLTEVEAKFVQDAIACRMVSLGHAADEAEDGEEYFTFISLMTLGTELATRLKVARLVDAKERGSGQ